MGILIGPPVGGLLPPIVASYVAISCVLGSLLYVVVVLEESLSEKSRLEVRRSVAHCCLCQSWHVPMELESCRGSQDRR